MAEIKVGQKWKWYDTSQKVFEVVSIDSNGYANVRFLDGTKVNHLPFGCWDENAILVEDVPEEQENNQLSPNAYQFPNGVEVRHISAHLTSFGGQAVQYIARATRLDGVVKGLPVQDLKKAIQLLEWEVERLES